MSQRRQGRKRSLLYARKDGEAGYVWTREYKNMEANSMSKHCCICGTKIGILTADSRYYNGKSFDICVKCQGAFSDVRFGKAEKAEAGLNYLRSKMEEGSIDAEAIPMAEEALELKVPDKESNAPGIPETPSSGVNYGIPFLAGILFLISAFILYFISVNNSDGVANIQATVFSAAAFVAAIVNFAASQIIKAVNSGKK